MELIIAFGIRDDHAIEIIASMTEYEFEENESYIDSKVELGIGNS